MRERAVKALQEGRAEFGMTEQEKLRRRLTGKLPEAALAELDTEIRLTKQRELKESIDDTIKSLNLETASQGASREWVAILTARAQAAKLNVRLTEEQEIALKAAAGAAARAADAKTVGDFTTSLEDRAWKPEEFGAALEVSQFALKAWREGIALSADSLAYLQARARDVDLRALNKGIVESERALKDQAVTFGATAGEAALYKFYMDAARNGVDLTAEAIRNAEAAAAKMDELQLFLKGKELAKEMQTPQEKFAERQKELNTLLSYGAITAEVYGRALEQAAQSMGQLNSASAEAVRFGTAAGLGRIAAYEDQMTRFRYGAGVEPPRGEMTVREGVPGSRREEMTVKQLKEAQLTRQILQRIEKRTTLLGVLGL